MTGSSLFLGTLQGSEAPADRRQRLALTEEDRTTGLHVIGAPKTGKSKFLEHCIRQDIVNRQGLCLIDPHGELYENVVEFCAYLRPNVPIIPLNLSRGTHVIGFNPFLRGPGDIAAQVERCLDAALKAWGATNTDESPRLDRILAALFRAIIEADDLSLCEAHYFVTYKLREVREFLTGRIQDDEARGNWLDISALRNFDEFNNQVESTRNRLGRFLRAQVTRRFLALTDPALNLDIPKLMDQGAVVLVNLKRSENLTKANQRLIGGWLVNAFVDAALRRDVGPTKTPRPYHLYLDEFHNFVTSDIGEAVTQVRKFGLTFILAHQTLSQVRKEDADILSELMGAVKARAVFGGLQSADALEIVPDLFPGQIDYLEEKYVEYINEFWPVYSRDKVYTNGSADVSGWADTSGSSSSGAIGYSLPDQLYYNTPGGTHFDSSGWGSIDAHTNSGARIDSSSVADIPIFVPERHVREVPHHFSLEEQHRRLADTLMLQLQRHCFIRPPNGRARPLLVPMVERYPLPESRVRAYEAEMAKKAGALTPKEVDAITDERRRRIEHQAREFAHRATADVHSLDHVAPPPTRRPAGVKLNPKRPKGAAPAPRPSGEEKPPGPVQADPHGKDPHNR